MSISADLFIRHDEGAAGAIAEIEQRASPGSLGSLWHPDELPRAAVLGDGDPHHGLLHGGVGRVGHVALAEDVAIEFAFRHFFL